MEELVTTLTLESAMAPGRERGGQQDQPGVEEPAATGMRATL